jgi:hypothetical protein
MDIAVMPLAAVAEVTTAAAAADHQAAVTEVAAAAAQTSSGVYLPCCRKRVLIREPAG